MSIPSSQFNRPHRRTQADLCSTPAVKTETVEEFLARGGKITKLSPVFHYGGKPDLTPVVEKKKKFGPLQWGRGRNRRKGEKFVETPRRPKKHQGAKETTERQRKAERMVAMWAAFNEMPPGTKNRIGILSQKFDICERTVRAIISRAKTLLGNPPE